MIKLTRVIFSLLLVIYFIPSNGSCSGFGQEYLQFRTTPQNYGYPIWYNQPQYLVPMPQQQYIQQQMQSNLSFQSAYGKQRIEGTYTGPPGNGLIYPRGLTVFGNIQ
ncbi:uncharacterized protein LOC142326245 [Lycorma delicatula]|uniref:uncharacterized protein LOC142326245 n=1 Tax=Lycorma delicatula TaxID=130591 RepID=UPI003F511EEB